MMMMLLLLLLMMMMMMTMMMTMMMLPSSRYAPLEPPPSVLQLDPSLRVVRQAVSSHLKSVVVHPVVQGLCDLKWRKCVPPLRGQLLIAGLLHS